MIKKKIQWLLIKLRLKKIKYVKRKFSVEDLEEVSENEDQIKQLKKQCELIDEIMVRALITSDDYIFEIIYPFLKDSVHVAINKQILKEALQEYFENHPDKLSEVDNENNN